MPGSSRPTAREAGSALLSLQQEDQENVNPEKVAPAQQPRAQIALRAGNARGNAPQQRFKTRRVKGREGRGGPDGSGPRFSSRQGQKARCAF